MLSDDEEPRALEIGILSLLTSLVELGGVQQRSVLPRQKESAKERLLANR